MIRASLTRARGALGSAVGRIPPRVRRWVNRFVLLAGMAALFVAAVLLVRPAAVGQLVDTAAVDRRLSGTAGIVAVVGGILLATTVGIWKGATATTRADAGPIRGGENAAVDSDGSAVPFDAAIETAIEADDEDRRADVRARLRSAAVETIAARGGRDDPAVREEVLTGEWTDDVVVGAFLGDERAADYPLRWRLYDWLYPDRAFREAVERTLTAIESYEPEEEL